MAEFPSPRQPGSRESAFQDLLVSLGSRDLVSDSRLASKNSQLTAGSEARTTAICSPGAVKCCKLGDLEGPELRMGREKPAGSCELAARNRGLTAWKAPQRQQAANRKKFAAYFWLRNPQESCQSGQEPAVVPLGSQEVANSGMEAANGLKFATFYGHVANALVSWTGLNGVPWGLVYCRTTSRRVSVTVMRTRVSVRPPAKTQ